MTYFCQDVDLLAWEPGIFVESGWAHQGLLKNVSGVISGTGLTVSGASLTNAGIAAGMVAVLSNADASLTQLVEIVAVTSATAMTVSALRGRATEAAVGPLLQGAVGVTVGSFRPQIGAVGDGLLALVGVRTDEATGGKAPVHADLGGFGPACVFGTLATVYRALSEAKHASSVVLAKREFYAGLAQAARLTLTATVDQDGDGVAETRVHSAVRELVRN